MTAVQDDVVVPLSRRQLALLRFSARHALAGTGWHARALSIWEGFGVDVEGFLQQLATALRHPAAEAAEPAEVRRLHRLLDRRAARRGAYPSTTHPGGTR